MLRIIALTVMQTRNSLRFRVLQPTYKYSSELLALWSPHDMPSVSLRSLEPTLDLTFHVISQRMIRKNVIVPFRDTVVRAKILEDNEKMQPCPPSWHLYPLVS